MAKFIETYPKIFQMKTFLLFISLIVLASVSFTIDFPQVKKNEYKIIGYIFGPRMESVESIEVGKLTHINYAFANIEEGEITEGFPEDSIRLIELNKLKVKNPALKLLVSVGGWSWSDGFSDAVVNPEAREKFANSAINFLVKHNLDGIDLDWEYPGQIGNGNTFRSEDKQNFTAVIKRIREKMDSLSLITGRENLLTIATAANSEYLKHVEMRKISKYLDFINIMTYDFQGGWNTETSHHTNLFISATDPEQDKRSAELAVLEHLKEGVPSEKLILGVAFYGRGWNGVNKLNNGLHQKAGKDAFSIHYKDIQDSLRHAGYTRYWDSLAQAPYLWNESSGTFITYDDTESLRKKALFIKQNTLGGAMFWEYHSDDGSLLEILYEQLIKLSD